MVTVISMSSTFWLYYIVARCTAIYSGFKMYALVYNTFIYFTFEVHLKFVSTFQSLLFDKLNTHSCKKWPIDHIEQLYGSHDIL